MVCKEDVLLWFKDLESYKRIDLMYEMLEMCVPFELRFLGSCVEEMGKHSFQELRGPVIIANDIEKLNKDTTLNHGLMNESVRHRSLVYLSLLSSHNCKCANWFYKTLLRTEWLESYITKRSCKDDNIQNELLLLFTMALYHPAFSFDQKLFFGEMVSHLIDQKEVNRQSKPFPGYPPGLGYPNSQKMPPDAPVCTKTSPMCHGEDALIHHPPGLPTHPTGAPVEFFQVWGRPGFPGTISGAPEIPPFPHQSISPLVSEPTSPTQSRNVSPHRTFSFRPNPGLLAPSHFMDVLSTHTPPLDPLIQSSQYCADVNGPNDGNPQTDENPGEQQPWANSVVLPMELKAANGYRFPAYNKVPQNQYYINQMQGLNLDGENSIHRSNSSSSSDSVNQSPPETPETTPTVPYHGPGRGEGKLRVNGVPPTFMSPPPLGGGAPLPCDPASPPPINNSVPYATYPPHAAAAAAAALPNRSSMFQYNQAYRPPFPYQPENVVYSYTCPYMPSFVFSSAPALAAPPRSLNCFNCGGAGHAGSDCTGTSIEDITQKGYILEYNIQQMPETDK